MRPGQTAPECEFEPPKKGYDMSCFNEAGADCPGMPAHCEQAVVPRNGFNEAGADCPGMLHSQARAEHTRRRFNEAGADCPGMRLERRNDARLFRIASMRPGQTAPECAACPENQTRSATRFNEAGADCPGMPQCCRPKSPIPRSFNEAGADCPGMPAI